jgi:L-malate glycosyltransferase
MHVLIVPNSYPNSFNPVSGIFFRDQAEALAKNGVKTGILAVVPITIKEIFKQKKRLFELNIFEKNGVTTYLFLFPAFPKTDLIKQWVRKKIGLWLFKKYAAKNGIPDIQHVHVYTTACIAQAIKRKYQVPYIITEHSSSFLLNILTSYQKVLARKAYAESSLRIAVSQKLAMLLGDNFGYSFSYVPNATDTDYFKPLSNRIPNKKYRLLNVANLNANKQHEMLLFCFQKIVKENPLVQLIIGGAGPEENRLRKLSSKLQLDAYVSFLGKLSRHEVLREMQKCDAFILSSKFETFGVVLIEAMACGKPVVTTQSGGPESIIINETYGILTKNSVESLSAGIVKMVNNKAYYNSENIRLFVEINFSAKAVSTQLKRAYRQVIEC